MTDDEVIALLTDEERAMWGVRGLAMANVPDLLRTVAAERKRANELRARLTEEGRNKLKAELAFMTRERDTLRADLARVTAERDALFDWLSPEEERAMMDNQHRILEDVADQRNAERKLADQLMLHMEEVFSMMSPHDRSVAYGKAVGAYRRARGPA